MKKQDGSASLPRRQFSRRAFAFILDAILATLIIALLFGAIRAATGIDLGTPGLVDVRRTDCDAAPTYHPQVLRVEAMWPLAAGETRQHVLCKITVNGTEQPLLFVTRVISTSGATTYTSEASYPVGQDGQPLPVRYPVDFSPLAYLAIFIGFTAGGRRTPGKASMALGVIAGDGGKLGWLTASRREALKFLPFLAYFVVTLWFALSPPAMFSDSEVIIVAMRDGGWFTSSYAILFLLLSLGTFVWWVGPFVLWRGRTWYDALSGTMVVRTDLDRTSARPPA